MKRFSWLIAIFTIFICMGFAACGVVAAKPLEEPRNFRMEGNVLVWDAVQNATEYRLELNGVGLAATEAQIDLTNYLIFGLNEITVWAKGDEKHTDSQRATYTFELIDTNIDNIDIGLEFELTEDGSGYRVYKESYAPALPRTLDIPATYRGLPVKAVGQLNSVASPSKIIMHEGVEIIEDKAFFSFNSLNSVELPDGVQYIGAKVFSQTRISELKLPDSVKTIGDEAFAYCTVLRKIEMPRDLRELGTAAFLNCLQLESIVLPEGVKRIDRRMFEGCTALSEIEAKGQLESVERQAFGDTQWIKTKEEFKVLSNALCRFTGEEIDGNLPEGVTLMANDCLQGSKIKRLVLPDYVKIDEGGCSYAEYLAEVVLPSGLEEIPASAFFYDKALTKINIPSSVKAIGDFAFEMTGLKNLTIESNVKKIGEYAFCDTPIESLILREGIEEIGESAFERTKISSVALPQSLKKLGSEAFSACRSLKSFSWNNSITEIPDGCFSSCSSLTRTPLPSTVTKIGAEAFSGCTALTEFPFTNIASIGAEAFANCGFKTMNIMKSFREIGARAFERCKNLQTVTFEEGIERIPMYIFYDCEKLSSVALPQSLREIADGAFESCKALLELDIPRNTEIIGVGAIYSTGITSITFPAIRKLNDYCLNARIAFFAIPDSVVEITDKAFSNAKALKELVIPESFPLRLTFLNNCSALEKIFYTGSEESWNRRNFDNVTIAEDTEIYFFLPQGQPLPDGGNYWRYGEDGKTPVVL